MDQEPDRLREKRKRLNDEPASLSHALKSGGEQDEERKANKEGEESAGVQLANNENLVLPWLCQGDPEPAAEAAGVYVLWDIRRHQLDTLPV